ncbi:hypothetical protein [Stenotrophomonas maltophilia]|uniref:hypothetical protein n=1 Tax=Stenotrophomonas maltophilia TaxID=40324 RepID=UPI000DA8EDF1|nr:hypothetical protein [Stenotrophomonas maltophilia]PZT05483.1 hypothetical protein A7X91_01925 [Stenotrophomonas maltophilia]
MSNDNKTLADVQPGGRVSLGDQPPALPRTHYNACGDGSEPLYTGEQMREYALAALSAKPSPGGQGVLETVEELAELNRACAALDPDYKGPTDAAVQAVIAALAARQPVGKLHLPPDGFYKIVFDDAEVPDESFARSGALNAALRRFEQISNKWNAHLFVRFANNTRDCTVPNATPAQAVDLGQFRDLAEFALQNAKLHNCWEKREALARNLLALIDSQAVGNG